MSDQAPDLLEPIVGYRVFRASKDGRLCGQHSRVEWTPGLNFASCEPESFGWPMYTAPKPHESPFLTCRCGLYAHYEAGLNFKSRMEGNLVGALVAAWGIVIPHSDGFRAQKMQVAALCDWYGRKKSRSASEHYRVPLVSTIDELQALAPQYGQPLPTASRLRNVGSSHVVDD